MSGLLGLYDRHLEDTSRPYARAVSAKGRGLASRGVDRMEP